MSEEIYQKTTERQLSTAIAKIGLCCGQAKRFNRTKVNLDVEDVSRLHAFALEIKNKQYSLEYRKNKNGPNTKS